MYARSSTEQDWVRLFVPLSRHEHKPECLCIGTVPAKGSRADQELDVNQNRWTGLVRESRIKLTSVALVQP